MTTDKSIVAERKTGLRKAPKLVRKTLPVTGMSCASCAASVESMLKTQEGVVDAGVNYANQSAIVEYQPEVVALPALQKVIQSIGYDLIIVEEEGGEKQEEAQIAAYKKLKMNTIWAFVFSFPVVIIGMFFMDMPFGNWIMLVLTLPVIGWFGRSFFKNAWSQAKHGRANMDTLVALSTGTAMLLSTFNTLFPEVLLSRGLEPHVYFEAATVIIFFILLGRLLEHRAKSNTSSAIKKLIGLQPKTVNIWVDGEEKEVAIAAVKVGDIVAIKPGARIPVDGTLVAGGSFVDESMISGEPVAVEKKPGDKVHSGTINQKGSFRFEAEKVGKDTFLAQIIKMVQEAQGSKAPVQKLVDKVAGIFVPIVIGLAIVTFVIWAVFGAENAMTHAFLSFVTVLVIACPCALGLATPTAIMVGVGRGAENGILIKDAESLEVGHKVNAIILDKTGTITEGQPALTDMKWAREKNHKEKAVLLAIESESEHPLADAVVRFLQPEVTDKISVHNFESITGRGVKAEVEGKWYFVGNRRLLEENQIAIDAELKESAQKLQKEAKTVIWFADDEKVIAVLAIADTIKGTSAKAISALKEQGIEVYMLTGDNQETAAAVSEAVGINNYRAEMLPGDKADFIKHLQEQGKVVAMVGDGINDSQALAQANLSIAMGKGSDIAIEVAKMTLISSDLNLIPKALRLSRQTVKTIKQNLFWAFIYNLIGIPIAAGVLYPIYGFLLDPMIAGAAMALSSVSVVTNSLRLKSVKLES